MKKLLKYMKDYRLEALIGPLFKWIEAAFELTVPLVVAYLIDVAIPVGMETGNRSGVWQMSGILALLGAVGLGAALVAQYFAAKAATGFASRLRREMFLHVSEMSYEGLDRTGTSEVLARFTGDLTQVQTGVNMFLRLFLRSPFVVFGAVIMALTVDVKASLVFVCAIPLLFVAVAIIMKLTLPGYRKVQRKNEDLYRTVGENIGGVRVLRAFGMEESEEERFDSDNKALTALQIAADKVSFLMNPVTSVMINGATVILIWSGALRVNVGGLSQGEVIALVNYMSQILVELIKLANLIVTVSKGIASGGRIADFLDGTTEEDDLPVMAAGDSADSDTVLEFENVTFRYPGAASPSLENISFRLKRGQTLGIIGPTGSGKSTLVNLIPRFYDADSGRVVVSGRDVRTLSPDILREKIGIAEQRSRIFSGSVRDNITFGRSIPDSRVWDALESALAADFVRDKGGLDYVLSSGGKNLSGGQKQRLNIARAVAREPEILILDDSSSALDFVTDAALRKNLAALDDVSVVVISQRVTAVRHADLILVLEDGECVGAGDFDYLYRECGVFAELCRSQGISEGGDGDE